MRCRLRGASAGVEQRISLQTTAMVNTGDNLVPRFVSVLYHGKCALAVMRSVLLYSFAACTRTLFQRERQNER